jgi:hypothetical protein
MRTQHPILLLAAVMAAGCFSYQETSLATVAPGQSVRVRISPEEADRLVELRLTDDRLVDGVLVSNGGDGLLLDTTVGMSDPQRGTRALRQRITIPPGEIREVELKRVNWLRTGALAGGVAVGVGVVIAAALEGGGGKDGPGGPDPSELVVPARLGFRLPLRIF